MESNAPIKSIETAFTIVEELIDNNGMTLSELTEVLDKPRSTVHDHIHSLREVGYVTLQGSKYYASTRFLDLGVRRRNQIAIYNGAKIKLREVAEQTGEHVSLVIEEDGKGIILFHERSDGDLEFVANAGARTYLHTNAPGKAILSQLSEEHVREIVTKHGLPERTENTVTDLDSLLDELEYIQHEGFATNQEERIEGLRSVAAPIVDNKTDSHAAISIYGPTSRISESRLNEELAPIVMEAANILSVNVNYSV